MDEVTLADVEVSLGRLADAEARVTRVLRHDRSLLSGWVVLGRIATTRGDHGEASRIARALRTVVRHRGSEEVRASLARLDEGLSPVP